MHVLKTVIAWALKQLAPTFIALGSSKHLCPLEHERTDLL